MTRLWHNRLIFAYKINDVAGVRFGTELHNVTVGTRGGRWFIELNAL